MGGQSRPGGGGGTGRAVGAARGGGVGAGGGLGGRELRMGRGAPLSRPRQPRPTPPRHPCRACQEFAAGIGNWVGDEVLHQARLHPEEPASALSDAQVSEVGRWG